MRIRSLISVAVLILASAIGLVAPTAAQAMSTAISATASSIWQTNGSVRALAYANGMIFVGGEFTSVRPPGDPAGTGEVARSYLAAFNSNTGALITSFAPNPNGIVWGLTASPDGNRVYVGGDFTSIGGQTHQRLAVIDTHSLSVVSSWKPNVSYRVKSIAATSTTVYFGGSFGLVNNVTRNRLAAVTADNATLLPWDPNANADVYAMAVAQDGSKVFAGGNFDTLGTQAERAFAAIDPVTGAPLPFPAQSAMPPVTAGCNSKVRDIIVDATTVFASAAGDGGGCYDGDFAADIATGTLLWDDTCLGATEAIQLINDWLYKGSHAHDCSSMGEFGQGAGSGGSNHFLLAEDPSDGLLGSWFPTTNAAGATQVGPLAFATDGTQLFVGGDFTQVNHVDQEHLTRFTTGPETPPKGPVTPVVASVRANQVAVTLTATTDLDDDTLTYNLYRSDSATPIKTFTMTSTFWNIPTTQVIDTGVTAGSSVRYRVEASDGVASVSSGWSPYVTVASSTAPYPQLVLGDGASSYWRLNEASGTTAADSGPANDTGTYSSVSLGQPGFSGSSTAAGFNGSNSRVSTASTISDPETFTEEAWIRTTTHSGGKILGFGDSQSGTSGSYDRHLYMLNNGHVTFGIYDNATFTVTSNNALNDGNWHLLTATMTPGTMSLYVDGIKQGTNSPANAQGYRGYWRIGGDNLNGWPNQPSSSYFQGSISDVAIYPLVLSDSQIQSHFTDAGFDIPPQSSFAAQCTQLSCSFDGSASSDLDGNVVSYHWDFGDGKSATTTTPTATHSYTSVGTYTVTLTVTDDGGASGSSTQTAVARPAPPTTTYAKAVYNDSPLFYWRLDDRFGTTAADSAGGGVTGLYYGLNTRNVSGALVGDSDTAVTFRGGGVSTKQTFDNPTVYSEEAWFRTSTTTGGKIIGFGSSQQGGSGSYDRHVYMQDNGQLVFGTWTGVTNTITTPASYNDNKWHQVVATQGPNGMALYVDGALVGTNPQAQAQDYTGYWRVGNDTTWSSTSSAFNGSIDEVAVYPSVLTATQVAAHYSAGTKTNQTPTATIATPSCAGLTCSFDGSNSADPDGTIASYSWDFGDGSAAGSGASPNHTYANGGTYTVTLTVTDNGGATGTSTATVTVAPPKAVIATPSCSAATCSFDGTGSTDPDGGTITSYSWDFGDGSAAGSGASPNHKYTDSGTYTVTLTVTDDGGATGTASVPVTVTVPTNQPPKAVVATPSCTGLSCSFDGSNSTDPDGTIASYSWDFGDGSAAGSGASPNHTYSDGGSYTVTLTVTDDQGATDTATTSVTVTVPPLAQDAFSRSVTNGLGTADIGGAWTVVGTKSRYSVANGMAVLTAPTAGSQPSAYLAGVSSTSTDLVTGVTTDKAPTGGGLYISVEGRRVDGVGDYRAKVHLTSTGKVTLMLERTDSTGAETTLSSEVAVAGLTYVPGMVLRIRVEVTGTSPTTVRARVWDASQSEPTTWQATATDSTAGLQTAGAIGIVGVLSGSATNSPVAFQFTNLKAVKL